ncbi:hypothetical protein PF008_g4177 [Phytophthora fragariae]|uniref:Uncharacterized protein n=1 Tax=Phytophthora fragariae TaxID=53985 RepID=A0A6G0SCM1_9STRA|nr:hypothetical protein PF008_g4177 [Phytophthora fragariae]
MPKLWDADAAKPYSPTSMDVLLRWLLTPGNYTRWQAEAKKPLVDEIVAQLKKEGISTRSPSAVRRRIFKLQQQHETATIWLKNEGHLAQYRNGTADEGVKKAVMERCPLYLKLMPIFHCDDANTSNGGNGTNAVEPSSGEVGIGDAEEKAKPAKLTAESAQGKRKRAPDVQPHESNAAKQKKLDLQALPVVVEGLQPHQPPVEADVAALETSFERRSTYPAERSLALAEFQRGSESRWNEYSSGVEHGPLLDEFRAQRLLDREIERVDALGKLQIEAEAKLQELRYRCANALSRQHLRNAGLSEDEVDSTIPK